ncbi:MAG TPA: DUF899 family protein [Nocardioidaceae bacterium]|nr:DUF899 family protein [Nocardioidaceae bacterium]
MNPIPEIVDRETWQRRRDELLVREKAHTREGDAIAAARRRLPMIEVANVTLTGPDGPVSLLDIFEGRDQLFVFQHMWHHGEPFENQCQGCTANVWNFQDATYLNARGVTFAVLCEGAYDELAPYRAFMGYPIPWYSSAGVDGATLPDAAFAFFLRRGDRIFLTYATDGRGCEVMMPAALILDMTVYGRQETWEDSPEGWPQGPAHTWHRRDGRPLPQWTRPGVTPAIAATEE